MRNLDQPATPRLTAQACVGGFAGPYPCDNVDLEAYLPVADLGGSRGNENAEAANLAERSGYHHIGGSDSHIVSHIGRCATRFEAPVENDAQLVASLEAGSFEAISSR